jgi:hypothetical protein
MVSEKQKAAEPKTINKLRFITKLSSVQEAEDAKKRLGIYDKEFSTEEFAAKWKGVIPGYLLEKFRRHHVKMGVRWEVKDIDGEVNYIFIPSGPMLSGLNARAGFGWMKLAADVQKEFEKMDCPVRFLFVSE